MNTTEQMWLEIERLKKRLESLETMEGVASVIDYSSTSTIVGWSAYDGGYPDIFYSTHGKLVFVVFRIEGTSDNTAVTFTLPYNNGGNIGALNVYRAMDNGTWGTGVFSLPTGSNIVSLFSSPAGAAWTASGNKRIQGQFFYYKA